MPWPTYAKGKLANSETARGITISDPYPNAQERHSLYHFLQYFLPLIIFILITLRYLISFVFLTLLITPPSNALLIFSPFYFLLLFTSHLSSCVIAGVYGVFSWCFAAQTIEFAIRGNSFWHVMPPGGFKFLLHYFLYKVEDISKLRISSIQLCNLLINMIVML